MSLASANRAPGVEACFERSDTARVEEAKEASVVDDVDVVGVGRMGGIQGHALTDAVDGARVVQTLDHGVVGLAVPTQRDDSALCGVYADVGIRSHAIAGPTNCGTRATCVDPDRLSIDGSRFIRCGG